MRGGVGKEGEGGGITRGEGAGEEEGGKGGMGGIGRGGGRGRRGGGRGGVGCGERR